MVFQTTFSRFCLVVCLEPNFIRAQRAILLPLNLFISTHVLIVQWYIAAITHMIGAQSPLISLLRNNMQVIAVSIYLYYKS